MLYTDEVDRVHTNPGCVVIGRMLEHKARRVCSRTAWADHYGQLFFPQGREEIGTHRECVASCVAAHPKLEAKGGGRKLALQNGKVEGSEVGKNTALFLEAPGARFTNTSRNQIGFGSSGPARSSRRQDALHKLGGANDSR